MDDNQQLPPALVLNARSLALGLQVGPDGEPAAVLLTISNEVAAATIALTADGIGQLIDALTAQREKFGAAHRALGKLLGVDGQPAGQGKKIIRSNGHLS